MAVKGYNWKPWICQRLMVPALGVYKLQLRLLICTKNKCWCKNWVMSKPI